MEYLISLIVGVFGKLIGTEIEAWAPTISRRLIERGVRRLPECEQEPLREEWLAQLNECPGNLSKLLHSTGCYFGARTIAARESEGFIYRALYRRDRFMYRMGFEIGYNWPELARVLQSMFPERISTKQQGLDFNP